MAPMKSRRLILTALLALVAVMALSGCAVETSDDAGGEPTADETRETATAVPEQTPASEDETPAATATESEATSEENSGFPVSVTRTDGVELTIEEPPERIVSLSPGATETFFAIGAGDQVAAVDMFSDYPPEATELPQVDAYQPDPEAIIDLDPDLVFVVFNPDGIVEILEEAEIPVLYLDAPQSIDGMMDQIRVFGDVTGNSDQADNLAGSLEDRVQTVVDRVEDVESAPSVYHELDAQFFTVGPESFIGDLYNLLGARNIAEAAEGDYPQLSQEIILEENPDVIILPSEGNPDEAGPEDVRQRPGWDSINAVQNDRIYEIDGDPISRPGPRIVDALEQLAELLYPEEFASSHELFNAWIDLEIPAGAL